MKKLTSAVFLALVLSLTGFSQTFTFQVEGYVYQSDLNYLEPVYNQPVTIVVDSTNTGFGYQNIVYTDQSGYFTDYILLPPEVGMAMVWVSTFDSCLGFDQVQYGFWAPGTILPSFVFMLCDAPPVCQASFYYETNPSDDKTVHFFNASLGDYDFLNWDFGDGTYSDETDPVHYYQQEGIYIVCLTISDSAQSCFDVFCLEVWVGNPVWPGCENYFFYTFIDSLTVQFEGYLINQQQALAYEWDFGDGNSGSGQFVTHTFTPGGVEYYDVCLSTMTVDSIGDTCYYTSCQPVYLNGYPPFDCYSWFDYTNDSLTATFNGYMVNGQPAEYTWEFGDGTTATGQQVTHAYAEEGNYYVTLATIDSSGCSWSSTLEVWIGDMTFSIFGFVYLDSSNLIADDAVVRLMTMDTLWQNVIEVANTTLNDNGYYQFDDVAMDNFRLYFVQAELSEGSAYYGDYIPTYHLSAMNWMEAWPVMPFPNWATDIYMIPGNPVDQGECTITGTVANLGVRENLEGVVVLLLDAEMNPYTYVKTDANGQFTFSGLGYGTYTVYAEMLGIITTPAVIVLDETHTAVIVEITVEGNSASYELSGISDQLNLVATAGEIYPNPVTSSAQILLTVKSSLKLDLRVINQTGQMIRQRSVSLDKGSQIVSIPMEQALPGIYNLILTSAKGDFIVRRMIKLN